MTRASLRAVVVYLLFGGAWIFLSDRFLLSLHTDPQRLTRLQTYKGWGFVLASGVVVFVLLRRELQRRQRAEHDIEESQRAMATLVSNLPGMVYRCRNDRDWTMEFVSDACLDLTGYRAEELIGNRSVSFGDLVDSRDRERVWEKVQRALETDRPFQLTYRICRADGESRWVWEQGRGTRASGGAVALEGFIFDITERKHAEERLQLQGAALESAANAILITDGNGVIEWVNPACGRVTGYAREEIIGKTPRILKSGKHDAAFYRHLWETILAGDVWQGEIINRRKDGTLYTEEMTITPVRGDDGVVRHFIAVKQDITRRKEAEAELARHAAELARSNDELERFAYVASHDLQEPLRMVASYTQLLATRYEGKLDSDADEFIRYAVDGVTHMKQLINGLLDYSRLDSRAGEPKPVEAEAILQRCLTTLHPSIAESDATVTHDPLPTVVVDETQLALVVQNLISNALKFRGVAAPEIHISSEHRNGEWVFSVRDNGIGILPEHRDRIFLIFQRLHNRTQYPGTGIGLSICKKVVERHGGRIWVESEPGNGSTFYFTIPDRPEAES